MEDKRVIKTKRNIRNTFIQLLQKESFEKITVAEICREGMVSRITFYTYYDSKYALLNEMIADYINEADIIYHKLQKENNPKEDVVIGYENLLECILSLYVNNYDFFSHTDSKENPYLFSEFFNHVLYNIDDYLERHKRLGSNYPTKQTAALICNGLFGVIYACMEDKMSEKEIRKMTKSMYRDMLQSRIFSRNG